MPIFHDPSTSPPDPVNLQHLDPTSPASPPLPAFDRDDLIDQLKRTNKFTIPSRHDSRPASRDGSRTPMRSPMRIRTSRPSTPDVVRDHAAAGLDIERPKSALHSGDFREEKERTWHDQTSASDATLATSPVVPWHQSFPAAAAPAARPSARSDATSLRNLPPTTRPRAISQSSFASFAFMPPTSPLVQQSNNTDLDFSSRPGSRQPSPSPEKTNRRHTFSPQSFSICKHASAARSAANTVATGSPRRGVAVPSQAHQPRRSITSFHQLQPQSNFQIPFGSRQSSLSSEVSPLHHAPMVGSYEESILRGRMSTTPSRPLNFIAKIGVLGKGQCKPNLKCPPHIAIPFPTVFYSYSTGNGRLSDDSPSPYVGLIDLENSLAPPEEGKEFTRRKRRPKAPHANGENASFRADFEDARPQVRAKEDIRRREKKKRRSTSPKAPPGGSYRIPQVGQLQIVIKNPNKTAVKLFLVPYDLSDMEPGQKTFVRQRSYSAGPILDMPLLSRKNFGTDRPEAALSNSDDPNDRPILRYLIHLNICCPSKNRYYLFRSVRVVFANRVPDGKEKLRNEIQLPEPRYSTYKATRESLASQAPSSAAAQLAAEKAMRRRSAGISWSRQVCDQLDGLAPNYSLASSPPIDESMGGTASQSSEIQDALAAIPFSLLRASSTASRPHYYDIDVDQTSPFRVHAVNQAPTLSNSHSSNSETHTAAFEKRNRDIFSGITSPGAGLLAQRLRGLDVQRHNSKDDLLE